MSGSQIPRRRNIVIWFMCKLCVCAELAKTIVHNNRCEDSSLEWGPTKIDMDYSSRRQTQNPGYEERFTAISQPLRKPDRAIAARYEVTLIYLLVQWVRPQHVINRVRKRKMLVLVHTDL